MYDDDLTVFINMCLQRALVMRIHYIIYIYIFGNSHNKYFSKIRIKRFGNRSNMRI